MRIRLHLEGMYINLVKKVIMTRHCGNRFKIRYSVIQCSKDNRYTAEGYFCI